MSDPASRRRVLTTLDHRPPDAVPIDFGSSPVTGIHCTVIEALRRHFGLPDEPVRVHEPYQMLGRVEPDLADAMGLDVQGVPPYATIFGFRNERWKPWRTPWGQDVLVSEHFNVTTDAAGNTFMYPEGDTAAPPSAQMPVGGFFFDTIIRQEPIDEARLDPEDNLEEFGPVDDAYLDYMQRECAAARATGRAVLAVLPNAALGDIALVPAPFLKHPRGIRDIAEWYMSTAMRQDYIHDIFRKQVEIALDNFQRLYDAVGDDLDVAMLCGTDFGTQESTFCSVDTFRELYLPYYRRMTDWIHEHTPWRVFKHSCGAVVTLLDAFVEAGFDILNPVQCSARGMDPATLKEVYGGELVFWGGGVDTQQTLPFGTPDAVRDQVRRRCAIFGAGGGFVFNAIHNIQANTPIENVLAMLQAVREHNEAAEPASG